MEARLWTCQLPKAELPWFLGKAAYSLIIRPNEADEQVQDDGPKKSPVRLIHLRQKSINCGVQVRSFAIARVSKLRDVVLRHQEDLRYTNDVECDIQ